MEQSSELRKQQSRNKQSARDVANTIAINTVNNIFNQRLVSRLKAIAIGKGDEPVEGLPEFQDLSTMSLMDAAVAASEGISLEDDSEAQVEEALEEAESEAQAVDEQPVVEEQPAEASNQAEEGAAQAEDESGEKEA